jgi:hypothetical protein
MLPSSRNPRSDDIAHKDGGKADAMSRLRKGANSTEMAGNYQRDDGFAVELFAFFSPLRQ